MTAIWLRCPRGLGHNLLAPQLSLEMRNTWCLARCALLVCVAACAPAVITAQPPADPTADAEGRVDRLINSGDVREAVALFDADADRTRSFDPALLRRLALAVLDEVAASSGDRAAAVEACLSLLTVKPHVCEPTITLNDNAPASARLRVIARDLPTQPAAASRRLSTLVSQFTGDDWSSVVDAAGAFPLELRVQLLAQAIAAGTEGVQFSAIDRLARVDHESALPILRRWAARDAGPGRVIALGAVARAGDHEALAEIDRLLPDLRGSDLLAGGIALATHKRPQGLKAIRDVLVGENELLHLEAAAALVRLGDPLGRTTLEAELGNPNVWIRLRALEKVREAAIPVSAQVWRQMTDEMPWVRVRAAQAALGAALASAEGRTAR